MKPIRWRAATAQKVPPPDSLTQTDNENLRPITQWQAKLSSPNEDDKYVQ